MTHLEQEIAYWKEAATRKDSEGLSAVAISFRNVAWLLEHQASWLEWVKTQELVVRESIPNT